MKDLRVGENSCWPKNLISCSERESSASRGVDSLYEFFLSSHEEVDAIFPSESELVSCLLWPRWLRVACRQPGSLSFYSLRPWVVMESSWAFYIKRGTARPLICSRHPNWGTRYVGKLTLGPPAWLQAPYAHSHLNELR